MLQWLVDRLARGLVLLAVLAVGAYFALQSLGGAPDAVDGLRQANPGWTIEKPRHVGLRLTDGAADPVFIDGDHVGPWRVQRLDCARVEAAMPRWLQLPPGRTTACLQLGHAAPYLQVLNHRTPEAIPELWTRHYEPRVQALSLPHWGGFSGSGAGGPAAPGRKHRSMGYNVDPAPGSGDPAVSLMAFYLGDETVLVVTLLPPPTP
jgi:hypothetical protein